MILFFWIQIVGYILYCVYLAYFVDIYRVCICVCLCVSMCIYVYFDTFYAYFDIVLVYFGVFIRYFCLFLILISFMSWSCSPLLYCFKMISTAMQQALKLFFWVLFDCFMCVLLLLCVCLFTSHYVLYQIYMFISDKQSCDIYKVIMVTLLYWYQCQWTDILSFIFILEFGKVQHSFVSFIKQTQCKSCSWE